MVNDDVIERAQEYFRVRGFIGETRLRGLCDELIAELRASRARIAELEQDARRLDWLDESEVTLILHGPHRTSIAAREVIDAAMAGEETQ